MNSKLPTPNVKNEKMALRQKKIDGTKILTVLLSTIFLKHEKLFFFKLQYYLNLLEKLP